MDKANGDAPFIPLYGTAVPGACLLYTSPASFYGTLGVTPAA